MTATAVSTATAMGTLLTGFSGSTTNIGLAAFAHGYFSIRCWRVTTGLGYSAEFFFQCPQEKWVDIVERWDEGADVMDVRRYFMALQEMEAARCMSVDRGGILTR
jgi:hypothetical protein